MVGLWVLYGVGIVAGIGMPLVLGARDRRVESSTARVGLEPFGSDLAALAMLSGGPGRVVDAVLTDLVERELVIADSNSLTAALEPDAGANELTMTEAVVMARFAMPVPRASGRYAGMPARSLSRS